MARSLVVSFLVAVIICEAGAQGLTSHIDPHQNEGATSDYVYLSPSYVSAVGDPGMKGLPRVMIEGWNFCNRACAPGDQSCDPSPRYADCVFSSAGPGPNGNQVTEADNAAYNLSNPDDYAEAKERTLGDICQIVSSGQTSYFWTAMLKSGNYIDHPDGGICGHYHKAANIPPAVSAAFNELPMNQPLMHHAWSARDAYGNWSGAFSGTWDLNSTFARLLSLPPADAPCSLEGPWRRVVMGVPQPDLFEMLDSGEDVLVRGSSVSYRRQGMSNIYAHEGLASGTVHGRCEAVAWRKADGTAEWWCADHACGDVNATPSYFELAWLTDPHNVTRRIYRNSLRTSPSYPWLMLYFGADAYKGLKGGYAWDGRGMMDPIPRSPDFIVKFFLNITTFTSSSSMYFLNMGACWKLDGRPCDGNTTTDITRYALMDTAGPMLCSAKSQGSCPPYHRFVNGTVVYPNNTAAFPYSAYKWYCAPDHCDPYSNPNRQEILKIAPHPEWAIHGFPAGPPRSSFVGQPTSWTLQVGALAGRLAFAGVEPAVREWTTLNVGPEMGLDGKSAAISQWDVADFDVLVPA